MKKFIAISILLGFGLMITLNSCKKKEEETSGASLTSTATLKGKVWAELDITNTEFEAAPAGTKIFVSIESQDLVNNPQYDNKTLIYETTVDASGNYSISVPAGNKSLTAKISGADFEYMQNQGGGTTKRTVYAVGTTTVTINAGDIEINDLYY